VELVGADADPLLDEDPLRDPPEVGVAEEFTILDLDRPDLVLPGAHLHHAP